ncbi:MAG: EamA family transporter [Liquorilactobacillus nagelii]|jgi:drug/metabolite transporter (DMT)-like permease|uniref:EamA family transporter n=1 Tax=Liquorilactobacillus nagelii TaxID=82688 RepID=UPI00242E0AEA|nr:EamA family transporter [Liquorilactobacillus nagelii]MCI1633126.1 DMT family transporter [Liquorilactobacillus nagelii]
MESYQKKGLFYAISSGILWGASGTVAQFLFSATEITPVWLTGIRLLFSGGLLLLFLKLFRRQKVSHVWQSKTNRQQLFYFAFFGVVPSQLAYFEAIHYGNAATATVIQFIGPLLIVIYLAISQLTWPRRSDLFCIMVAFAGVFLLVTRGSLTSLTLSPAGIFWGFGAAAGQAAYTLLPRKLLQKNDTGLIVGWAMLLGSLPFIPLLLRTKIKLSITAYPAIAYVIVGGTLLAYLFYLHSLKYLQPAITGMLSSFEPLTATILAVAFLGVTLNAAEIAGIMLVLAPAFFQALDRTKKFHS